MKFGLYNPFVNRLILGTSGSPVIKGKHKRRMHDCAFKKDISFLKDDTIDDSPYSENDNAGGFSISHLKIYKVPVTSVYIKRKLEDM